MGRVMLARSRASGAQFVIKTLIDPEEKPAHKQRFLREAQSLAQIKHAHVVGVHDFGEVQGQAYLVMDYIEGQTLEERVRDAPEGLDIGTVTDSFVDLADALQALHEQGIIHRDIKPSNVLIESGSGRVVLVDLGLVMFESSEVEALTKTGQMLGSPGFMAPEQLAVKRGSAMGPWTDVWGFGATLFYALTGQRPVAGSSFLEFAGALATGHVREISDFRELPVWLKAVCDGCLRLETQSRLKLDTVKTILRTQGERGLPLAKPIWIRAFVVALVMAALLAATITAVVLAGLDRQPPELELKGGFEERKTRDRFFTLKALIKDQHPKALRINDAFIEAKGQGFVRKRLKLKQGLNEFRLQALDHSGLRSSVKTLRIISDNRPPRLKLTDISITASHTLSIRGTLNKSRCKVRIQGREQTVTGQELSLKLPIQALKTQPFIELSDDFGLKHRQPLPVAVISPKDKVSLSRIIENLPDNSLVILKPGQYRLSVEFERSITLVGLGDRRDIVLSNQSEPLFRGAAPKVSFQNLSLEVNSKIDCGAYWSAGHLSFSNCHLILKSELGLNLGEQNKGHVGLHLTIQDCAINTSGKRFLEMYAGEARFENTLFEDDRTTLELRSSHLGHLFLHQGGRYNFESCEFRSLKNIAIKASNCDLSLRYCIFKDTSDICISAGFQARVWVAGCDFEDCGTCAISLQSWSLGLIVGCRMVGTGLFGSASYPAILVSTSAHLEATGCLFTDSQYSALNKRGDSRALFQKCLFQNSRVATFVCEYLSGLEVKDCHNTDAKRIIRHPRLKPTKSIAALVADLSSNSRQTRELAFSQLFGREQSITELLKPPFVTDMRSDILRKIALLGALGKKAQSALPVLIGKALTSPHPILQQEALGAIREIGLNHSSRQQLRAELFSDNIAGQSRALQVFAELKTRATDLESRAQVLLKEHKNPTIRAQALRYLTLSQPIQQALEHLRKASVDPSTLVQNSSADLMTHIHDSQADALLLKYMKSRPAVSQQPWVSLCLRRGTVRLDDHLKQQIVADVNRRECLYALMNHGPFSWDKGIELLTQGVLNQDPVQQSWLISLLVAHGVKGQRLQPILRHLLQNSRHRLVRVASAWALRTLGLNRELASCVQELPEGSFDGVRASMIKRWLRK